MNDMPFLRKTKMAALTTLLAGGMMLGSACSLADFRHSVIAGTLGFVEGYTTDAWIAWAPPPGSLLNPGDAAE